MASPKKDKTKNKCPISKRLVWLIALLIVVTLIILMGVELWYSNTCLVIDTHIIESDSIDAPVRLGIISDLHSIDPDERAVGLYEKFYEQNPDLILLLGDVISSDKTSDEDLSYITSTVSALKSIAPVYFCIGNHERFNPRLEDILTCVSEAGGKCLVDSYLSTDINGNIVCIGGISYYRSWDEASNDFLKEFVSYSGERFTLLLCHHPEFYEWGIRNYPIDLMVSGHTHGGMIQLPLIGALYAPEQGWFPDHADGLHEGDNGYLAVTTGIGASPEFLPRMFNPPQIMIIDVI